MQTLGISNSTPKTENRLKNLFWPTIETATDVDTLGAQGYWVCAIIAAYVFIYLTIIGHPILGFFLLVFYYLSGVGVREHSRYAAAIVFVIFLADTLAQPGILKVFLTALLLSNLRATWIASRWKSEAGEAAMPIRLGNTWGDKFADKLPLWLWPKIRIPFYVFSGAFLLFIIVGLAMIRFHLVH